MYNFVSSSIDIWHGSHQETHIQEPLGAALLSFWVFELKISPNKLLMSCLEMFGGFFCIVGGGMRFVLTNEYYHEANSEMG